MDDITILICTHNRQALLERVISSLNACTKPPCGLSITVVANACHDDTVRFLRAQACRQPTNFPIHVLEEKQPGKSHALNLAFSMIQSTWVAMVDDDHRVHPGYLSAIYDAAREHPDTDLFCGRIIPDWDGNEKAWLHDTGPYSVYPLPIPHYDLGLESFVLQPGHRLPGGGNWVVRNEIFTQVGRFSTALGPSGHDLNGGEDIDYVHRALAINKRIRYVPSLIQYHYVDLERLTLPYLLKKAFYRSRSAIQASNHQSSKIPPYLLRKLATYVLHTLSSLYWPETRFYLMRCASTLGELSAYLKRQEPDI